MKAVWVIWEYWSNDYMWAMYEQDGHMLIFETKALAKRFVECHPYLIPPGGKVGYFQYPLYSKVKECGDLPSRKRGPK